MSPKLPQIDYWLERVDDTMVAVHAQRRYDDEPRYTAFLMFQTPAGSQWMRGAWRDAVREKLESFELKLFKHYGRRFFRQWQEDV